MPAAHEWGREWAEVSRSLTLFHTFVIGPARGRWWLGACVAELQRLHWWCLPDREVSRSTPPLVLGADSTGRAALPAAPPASRSTPPLAGAGTGAGAGVGHPSGMASAESPHPPLLLPLAAAPGHPSGIAIADAPQPSPRAKAGAMATMAARCSVRDGATGVRGRGRICRPPRYVTRRSYPRRR